MPYSPKHKEQTRQRILQAAAKLFCSKGFDRVTLNQIMKQANMTHGAFYAHFSGKSSLYEAALKFATAKGFWARAAKQTEDKETHLKALQTADKVLAFVRGLFIIASCLKNAPKPNRP